MARLPRLIGGGRALEVLLVADDIDAARRALRLQWGGRPSAVAGARPGSLLK